MTTEPSDVSAEAQLATLFQEQYAPMVRLATLLTGSEHRAEEVVMDAFARLTPRIDSLETPAAYLRTSVVNGTRSHHRRLRTVRRQPPPRVEPVDDPEVDELWQRLDALRPDERTCVVMRFYLDLPLAEIAEQLDMPLGTVKSHLHRAVATLRDLLTEEER
jgi:RNA polymerase sigma factor (sigma-70 family)